MDDNDTHQALEQIKFKFANQKLSPSLTIDGREAIKIIQSILKHSSDLQDQLNLYKEKENIMQKSYTMAELQYLFIRIKNDMNKRGHLQNYFYILGDDYVTLNHEKLVFNKLPRIKQCQVQIHKKNIFQIIPYELSMIKQFSQDKRPVVNILKRKEIACYYTYNHAIYSDIFEISTIQAMPKFVRFLYHITNFEWQQAYNILIKDILIQKQYEQQGYPFSVILKDFADISRKLKEAKQKVFRNYFLFKTKPTLNIVQSSTNMDLNIRLIVIDFMNLIEETEYYCRQVATQFKNPYFRAVARFMSLNIYNQQDVYQQICYDPMISQFMRFLMARRFMNKQNYDSFVSVIHKEMKQDLKFQHIIFLDHHQSSFDDIQKLIYCELDKNVGQAEKISLISLNTLYKFFEDTKVASKEKQAVEKSQRKNRCKDLIDIHKSYERYLKSLRNFDIYNKYMQEILNIPKTGTKISTLTLRPQCIFMHGLQKKPRTLVTSLEYLLSNPKEEKKQSLRNSMTEQKKDFPEAHCAICNQTMTSFNPLMYANSEIKKINNDAQSPFIHLTQNFDDALVWCPSCKHGGHLKHIEDWFQQIKLCPFKSCKCQCKSHYNAIYT